MSGDDTEASDSDETVSRRSESESRGDDVGMRPGSGNDAKAGFEAGSGDDETGSSTESDFDSDADGDSTLESSPKKRMKRAFRA